MSRSTDKRKLLDESDEEGNDVQLTVNKDYATRYENWRKKEEYQKLKDKYGAGALSEGSELSGSDDSSGDSDQEELSMQLQGEDFHKSFMKTLSAIKKGDPSLLDPSVSFAPELPSISKSRKENKQKKMTLMDYHVKLVKERKGVTEEDEEPQASKIDNGYYEQLHSIKNEFKAALDSSDEDDDESGLIRGVKKIENVEKSKSSRSSPIPLEEPKDEDEKFLFDYIVKKKYLNEPDVQADCKSLWKKNTFVDNDSDQNEATEHTMEVKQHRFEESNAGEIKRFPRAIQSTRDLGVKEQNAAKRREVKERKKKEKEEDLKRFSSLRAQLLQDKLKKLKEISGNDKFVNKKLSQDIDMNALLDNTDFDPEKHDANMSKLFGQDYDDQVEDGEKPQFEFIEGIDDDMEEFDEDGHFVSLKDAQEEADDEDDIEEENDEEEEEGTSKLKRPEKKKRKRREKKKKKIDIDQLPDYDDVISGQLPVRFKYRKVKPHDFGLSPEEIVMAEDKELNAWVSLKKAVGFRPEEEEAKDMKIYERRRQDWQWKKRILASLFKEEGQDKPEEEPAKKKKKRVRRKKKPLISSLLEDVIETTKIPGTAETEVETAADQTLDSKTKDEKELKARKRQRNKKKALKLKNFKTNKGVKRLQAYGLTKMEIKRKRLASKVKL